MRLARFSAAQSLSRAGSSRRNARRVMHVFCDVGNFDEKKIFGLSRTMWSRCLLSFFDFLCDWNCLGCDSFLAQMVVNGVPFKGSSGS